MENPQKYIGVDLIPNLKAKYNTLQTEITNLGTLIGNVDAALKTLDTGAGV